jgi:outer membrane autotransporter protein
MGAVLEPFANLAYVNVRTDGFTEAGGLAALTGHAGGNSVTFTTLGLHASTDFTVGGVQVFAKETLGWRHAFGDVNPTSTHSFSGDGNPFNVSGISVQPDAAIMTASLGLKLGPNTILSASYDSQFSSTAVYQGARANLSIGF